MKRHDPIIMAAFLFVLSLMLLMAHVAQAGQSVADTCEFSWNYDQPIGDGITTGFRLSVDGLIEYEGTATTVACSALTGVTWTNLQTYTFALQSYGPSGVSDPTTTVILLDSGGNLIDAAAAQEMTYVSGVPGSGATDLRIDP